MRWLLGFGLLAVSVSVRCAGDESAPEAVADLIASMTQILDREHVPGAGIALIAEGEALWCGGIGKADVGANIGVTCDTQFRVGSISKSFVALALLKLEQEGRIDLQARVQDVAPEIPMNNPWEASNPVRVVNVLEHSAGFDDMSLAEVYNSRDPPDIPLLQVLRTFPRMQDVRWPPGTRMAYSNSGYGVAGYLIEKVSRRPWRDYVRDNVLLPLDITTGEFALTDANRARLAQGYHDNSRPALPYREIYLRPAGDMKASPRELAQLVRFFLHRGVANATPILEPEAITRMEFPQASLAARNGLRLGYGLANYTEVSGGVTTHGHDGGIDGFVSSYRYMPEQNWGYVLLLNSDASEDALQELGLLAAAFLGRDSPRVGQTAIDVPASELEKFVGFYAPRAPRNQLLAFVDDLQGGIRVQRRNGQLTRSSLFGAPEALVAAGKNLFRLDRDPEGTAVFFENAEGVMCYAAFGDVKVPYAERTSPVWPYARLGLLASCVVLIASALLFAAVWVPRWVFGRMRGVKHVAVRAVPLVASLTLLAAFAGALESVEQFSEFGFFSVLFFAGMLLFAALSFAGLWLAFRVPRTEIHRAVRVHSLLVCAACCVITIFLAQWHLIGLRLWAA